MTNQILCILCIPFLLLGLSSVYAYPWDDPKLDIEVSDSGTAFKQREFTVFIDSCDSVQKTCYTYKNKIPYVPIVLTVEHVSDEKRVFVEEFTTETQKNGMMHYPIKINHKYDGHAYYEVTVTGTYNNMTSSEIVGFWTQQKLY